MTPEEIQVSRSEVMREIGIVEIEIGDINALLTKAEDDLERMVIELTELREYHSQQGSATEEEKSEYEQKLLEHDNLDEHVINLFTQLGVRQRRLYFLKERFKLLSNQFHGIAWYAEPEPQSELHPDGIDSELSHLIKTEESTEE